MNSPISLVRMQQLSPRRTAAHVRSFHAINSPRDVTGKTNNSQSASKGSQSNYLTAATQTQTVVPSSFSHPTMGKSQQNKNLPSNTATNIELILQNIGVRHRASHGDIESMIRGKSEEVPNHDSESSDDCPMTANQLIEIMAKIRSM